MARWLLVILIGCVWGAVPGVALGTDVYMQRLPLSSRFGCLNCHTVQSPTIANATLNPFGDAFKANDMRWDAFLASQSSDGDNCTNGFELGDENGDGKPDEALTSERKNPGQEDCTLQLDEKAWGALKQLFR